MNLFAFLGDDELRKQEALEAAVAKWQAEGGGDTCQREVWFGDDMRWEQAAESFQTQDLFASRKTLIVKNWQSHRGCVPLRGEAGRTLRIAQGP